MQISAQGTRLRPEHVALATAMDTHKQHLHISSIHSWHVFVNSRARTSQYQHKHWLHPPDALNPPHVVGICTAHAAEAAKHHHRCPHTVSASLFASRRIGSPQADHFPTATLAHCRPTRQSTCLFTRFTQQTQPAYLWHPCCWSTFYLTHMHTNLPVPLASRLLPCSNRLAADCVAQVTLANLPGPELPPAMYKSCYSAGDAGF